jgi:hypothetical protein
MLTHTAGKAFSCPQCSKSFTREDSMQNHLKLHVGCEISTGIKVEQPPVSSLPESSVAEIEAAMVDEAGQLSSRYTRYKSLVFILGFLDIYYPAHNFLTFNAVASAFFF